MLRKLSLNITSGIEKIKWFFSIIAERVKIEIAVVRLLGKSEQYEKEKQNILIAIGERVVDLRDSKTVSVHDDAVIRESLKELDNLEEKLTVLRQEAHDISVLET